MSAYSVYASMEADRMVKAGVRPASAARIAKAKATVRARRKGRVRRAVLAVLFEPIRLG